MTVKDTSNHVGDRLIHVGPGHKYAEDGGDIPRRAGAGSGTFTERCNGRAGRGGKSAQGRGLPRGDGKFAMSLRKSRHGIDQQGDVQALVPKVLGDRHRRPCGAAPDLRRPIGRRRDDNRPGKTLRPQNILDKFADLATPLPNKTDHDDICGQSSCQICKQGRFAHSGPRKKTNPLAKDNGKHGVKDGQSGCQARPEPPAGVRRRGGGLQRPRHGPGKECPAVQWPAVGIDDTPNPAIVRTESARWISPDKIADRDAVDRPLCEKDRQTGFELDHFRPDRWVAENPGAMSQRHAITKSRDFDPTAGDGSYPTRRVNQSLLGNDLCNAFDGFDRHVRLSFWRPTTRS